MSELTLTTPHEHSLLGLVRAALDAQERVLLTGIFRTQERLRAFEEKYQMSTDEFSARFADDELEESLDFVEWVGERRMLARLEEKLAVLREISIEE